ncbi:MAG: redox-sensitive transcriptional activator SoxR [Pseudomonadota bacterium]
MPSELTIGDLSRRTGVSVSALHFYERKGLIAARRSAANHRLYPRSILRRVAVIRIAQKAGVSLAEIAAALAHLPEDRAITTADWARVSTAWRDALSQRITLLTSLRDDLSDCIGCGCLSVTACPLVNADDHLGARGPGAHRIEGDR